MSQWPDMTLDKLDLGDAIDGRHVILVNRREGYYDTAAGLPGQMEDSIDSLNMIIELAETKFRGLRLCSSGTVPMGKRQLLFTRFEGNWKLVIENETLQRTLLCNSSLETRTYAIGLLPDLYSQMLAATAGRVDEIDKAVAGARQFLESI